MNLSLSTEIIDVGDEIIVTATFTDLATGQLADPTEIAWQIRDPDGGTEGNDDLDIPTVHTSVGVWELIYRVTKNIGGTWHARAAGTEGLISAAEGPFFVRDSVFASP